MFGLTAGDVLGKEGVVPEELCGGICPGNMSTMSNTRHRHLDITTSRVNSSKSDGRQRIISLFGLVFL